MAATRSEVLLLYRQILRTAEHWPSVRRRKVIEEIKLEFREHASEADPAALAKHVEAARAGLESLQQQCGMSKSRDIAYDYDRPLQRR